jgi:hypothetical protein
VGVGFSLAGARSAAGYRFYFSPGKAATPFVGLSGTWASGLSPLNVRVNNDSAKYKINSGFAVAPRAGFRFRIDPFSIYVNTGYHFVVAGGGAEYLSGSTRRSVRTFAEIVAVGGFDLCGGAWFQF